MESHHPIMSKLWNLGGQTKRKKEKKQVLLFGAETWLVTPKIERALSGFLYGAARRLTGRQIKSVPRFTYLGRVMTAGDDDWPALAGNLAKARKSWGRLQGILRREGATPRISGTFFKAVVQQVLLFGAETWVVTPKIERALSGFLHGAPASQ